MADLIYIPDKGTPKRYALPGRPSDGIGLKTWRDIRQLRQYQVADRAGISASHYCRIEAGEFTPTLVTAYKIADALDVQVEQIFPMKKILSDKFDEE